MDRTPLLPTPRTPWDRWCMAWALRDAARRGIPNPTLDQLCRPLLRSAWVDEDGCLQPPFVVFAHSAATPDPHTEHAMDAALRALPDPGLFLPHGTVPDTRWDAVTLADGYACPFPPHAHSKVALMAEGNLLPSAPPLARPAT